MNYKLIKSEFVMIKKKGELKINYKLFKNKL